MRAPHLKLPALELSPIFAKEMAGRMRSARAYMVLTVYLAIVSGLSVLLYMVSFLGSPRTVSGSGAVGTVVFYFLVGMQVLLASFVAPAFTAGAISLERENKTFDVLRVTLLTPAQIVWAKLISALGFTLLLLFATLPLFSLAFLLGGVEPRELIIALCVVFASALMYALLALYISARSRTTVGATLSTYAIVLGVVIGIPLAALIGSSTVSLALAPTSGSSSPLADLFDTLLTLAISLSPISAIAASQRFFSATGELWTFTPSFTGSGLALTLPSPFLILTGVYLIASVILYMLTVRRVARIEQQ
ncbi:MAG: hypothetical protein RMN52_06000 [Anaerolineae bacterium]|nr:ABC transporter permease [Candidatus Roseilinea sp.]MDW8449538.1 hypothetical protein [Anaerolineae bacterium]